VPCRLRSFSKGVAKYLSGQGRSRWVVKGNCPNFHLRFFSSSAIYSFSNVSCALVIDSIFLQLRGCINGSSKLAVNLSSCSKRHPRHLCPLIMARLSKQPKQRLRQTFGARHPKVSWGMESGCNAATDWLLSRTLLQMRTSEFRQFLHRLEATRSTRLQSQADLNLYEKNWKSELHMLLNRGGGGAYIFRRDCAQTCCRQAAQHAVCRSCRRCTRKGEPHGLICIHSMKSADTFVFCHGEFELDSPFLRLNTPVAWSQISKCPQHS
jgi:hypothetical protein